MLLTSARTVARVVATPLQVNFFACYDVYLFEGDVVPASMNHEMSMYRIYSKGMQITFWSDQTQGLEDSFFRGSSVTQFVRR
jgi:hypothetical protein